MAEKSSKNSPSDLDSAEIGHPKVRTAAAGEPVIDAVWGEISADGPNYRNLGW